MHNSIILSAIALLSSIALEVSGVALPINHAVNNLQRKDLQSTSLSTAYTSAPTTSTATYNDIQMSSTTSGVTVPTSLNTVTTPTIPYLCPSMPTSDNIPSTPTGCAPGGYPSSTPKCTVSPFGGRSLNVSTDQALVAVHNYCASVANSDLSGGSSIHFSPAGQVNVRVEVERLASPDYCTTKLFLTEQDCQLFYEPIVHGCKTPDEVFYGGKVYWSCYELMITLETL